MSNHHEAELNAVQSRESPSFGTILGTYHVLMTYVRLISDSLVQAKLFHFFPPTMLRTHDFLFPVFKLSILQVLWLKLKLLSLSILPHLALTQSMLGHERMRTFQVFGGRLGCYLVGLVFET